MNLIVYFAYMYYQLYLEQIDQTKKSDYKNLLEVCQLVTNNLNYFVMFFYTYQLRIVHIKLSTQTPDDFYREIKKTNIIWLALFIE